MDNDSTSRIVQALSARITTAAPGSRLPSTRSLVAEYSVSPGTVQKALRTLTSQGLVETRPGAGTFVRSVRPVKAHDYGWQTSALRSPQRQFPKLASAMRDASVDAIALHAGYPARELLPERLVRAALSRVSRNDTTLALTRAPGAGLPDLQAWFANELATGTGPHVSPPSPSDVIVLPGSQSGLSSIFRALVTSGQPVLMESPTYWGAILAAAQAGVRVVPVRSGPEGPDPDDVCRAFQETGARVFYAQPNFASPTGVQWSDERRRQVLDVVRDQGAFLVEDDWAHDFGIDTDPRPVAVDDDAGHVVYVRSLTKSVSPALRVAAVIARGPAHDRILVDRGAESMYVSGILQAATLHVVTQPGWKTHLRSLRQQLRARRDLLVDSLAQHAPDTHVTAVPPGGLNLWVRVPDTVDLERLSRDCESDGLLVAAGGEWFPAEPTARFVRLSYSGPNPGNYPRAAQLLQSNLERQ